MKKTLTLMGLIIFLAFTLSACMLPLMVGWKICSQPNTKWVSDDGNIVFHVDDSGRATGTMNVNGKIIDVYVVEGQARGEEMYIFPADVLEHEIISEKDKYEHWICSYNSEKNFVATVKKTTFYEVGQELTFHRADDKCRGRLA